MFYKDATLGLNAANLLKNYESNALFIHLLYPYLERETLFNIKSFPMQSAIIEYLTASCKIIARFARNIDYKFPGKKPVFIRAKTHEQQYHPEFLSYLECRFELYFNGNNPPLKKVNDDKVVIADSINNVSIEFNNSRTKANLLRNNIKIFEFDTPPEEIGNRIEFSLWDPEGFTLKSNFSQVRDLIFFYLKLELMKMIFSWIAKPRSHLPIQLWQADLHNDLLILAKDKKLFETVNEITSRYGNVSSKFLKLASQIVSK